ncbi:DUF4082 domain-containing protein [Arthrobacter rhombi]|uniref:DUF4082 domain-containing protein n=1 Tax=Arthrobacter rhombi TaxID=71253 RepID=A0A1R4GTU7_9MICC|nr:DUF4082 domain-containing protein [Arthrobacter rhombi]SJM71710.1 hypothetical protein FM101_13740 [Arthrobacter rhombi]
MANGRGQAVSGRRPTWWKRRVEIVALSIAVLFVPGVVPVSAAADPCAPDQNKIVCENSKPGTPWQEWEIDGAGDSSIQGFATDISVNVGKTIEFKIDTDASDYTIDIYRTGWYQGLGARKIASVSPSASLPQNQPECLSDVSTELTDCGTWAVSASWAVPADAVSGVYLAKLTRKDNGDDSHITFIVRDESSHSDVLFQTSDPTWHAYNTYGGSDFYSGGDNGRAYKISYNRPFATRAGIEARDFYFGAEYPMVRFLERNGYDVSYFSGVDTDRLGSLLTNHQTFLSVGHDEYWSGGQRKNVEAARDAGVNLQFLSGNEVYWRTRYEPSSTGGNDYRTLTSYKETWSNSKIDPSDEWTGTWRDPRFASTDDGAGLPENGLTGTAYVVNNGDLPVTVNDEEGKLRLWRNTSLSALPPGTKQKLAPHTVGYESDEPLENGFRPPGLINLSTTTGEVSEYLQDFGNVVAAGETTHHVTLYKASSGALVFSAGSIQWTWGLDEWHDGDGAPADAQMQQAEVNLLADMGAQPQTLMDGLATSSASTDKTAPTVNVTSAPEGVVKNGDEITVSGTASDAGGRVAGVEYSTDGGTSWRAAQGTTAWTFNTIQHGVGNEELLVRGIDDSANYPPEAAAIPLNVKGPYTVFGNAKPESIDSGDGSSTELGLRFSPTADGYISGVRFYKSKANTGTHTGTLWSLTGEALATADFQDETNEGWQSLAFDTPVAVTAGTEYIVSYSAPKGHYSADLQYFAYRGTDAAPLKVEGGFNAPSAGVYKTDPGFPVSSYEKTNYFVDPVFETTADIPLSAGVQEPADTAVSVPTTAPIGVTLSKPVVPSSVIIKMLDADEKAVSGQTTYDPETRRATFNPTSEMNEGTTYSVSVMAEDSAGNAVEEGANWSFRTVLPTTDPTVCPCGLFSDSTAPTIPVIKDGTPVTLGTRFSADVDGKLTGLEFYRSPGETGPHQGWLYSTTGTVLGTVTFKDDSVSGWQYAKFDTPVDVSAGTEYVAAYRSNGTYAATPGAFSNDTTSGPLRTSFAAGHYGYDTGFPGSQVTSSYLVDVRFVQDAPPISVSSRSPEAGANDVDPTADIKATFTEALKTGASLAVSTSVGDVDGSTKVSANGKTLTFTADAPLPSGTVVTVTPTDISGVETGEAQINAWSFRTTGTGAALESFQENEEPTQLDPQDGSAVELGMRMKATQDVELHAVRYYKGPMASGKHTGTVWDESGTKLATVTFSSETSSGWQTAYLDQPVEIAANEVFTVSYHAPTGGYVFSPSAFSHGQSKGSLSLVGSNGVFVYGSGSALPTDSWNDTNYFVDVLYSVPDLLTESPGSSPTAAPTSATATPDPSPSASPTASTSPTPSPSPSGSSTQAPEFPAGVSWLMDHTANPSDVAYSDESRSVELGLEFTTSEAITVYGVGFDKSTDGGEPLPGYLYDDAGVLMGTATFTGHTGSGWQEVTFDEPIPLGPGTYTVSYFTPHGGYAWAENTDFAKIKSGPVSATSTNGRYRYSDKGGNKPVSTYRSSNYFVDVAFTIGN